MFGKKKQPEKRRLSPEQIAEVCHNVNKAYCEAMGDDSQVSWEEASEWQKSSAIHGVMYHLTHPDSTPEDSHKGWMEQKLKEGWKWGKHKNPEKKEHPCIVAFKALPIEQKAKDHLFLAVVRALENLEV